MRGIDLNQPLVYKHASMRYFGENEAHINRVCKDDVLLLVYRGVLRFCEDGVEYAVHPGQYHIQKHGSTQRGNLASDMPAYLYVHFLGSWADSGAVLPGRGEFDIPRLRPLMERLDMLAHGDYTAAEQNGCFLEILTALYRADREDTLSARIAGYLEAHMQEGTSLDELSERFHFSKNHIINLFRKAYGITPTEYLNTLRLQKAMHLLEATPDSAEEIACTCGFHSYSHFYRLFLRRNQMPPTVWRQKKRLSP